MANIMIKRGSEDNVLTYEFMCDTTADMADIDSHYITLGSTCIVLQGESEGLEIYIANTNKEWEIVSTVNSGGAALTAIAQEYDSTDTYAVGDYCVYNDTLYKCSTEISAAEEWNENHWTATSVMAEVNNYSENIENVVTAWLDEHPEATTTVVDGSITKAKLDSNLKEMVDDVAELKSAINDIEDSVYIYEPTTPQNSIDVSEYAGSEIKKITSEISVSTAETTFDLYCCGKNHCMLPNDTVTQYGLTRTWNSDGTITLNGTPDRNVTISLGTKLGVYNTGWRFSIQKSSANSGVNLLFNGNKYSESVTQNAYVTAYFKNVSLQIDKDTVLENYVVRPMLEFAPYSETVEYEAFSGFVKTHTFDAAVTSGSIDWGSVEIPDGADTLWMYDTGNLTTIYDVVGVVDAIEELKTTVSSYDDKIDGAYAHEYAVAIDGWSDSAVTYTDGFINSTGTVTSNNQFRHSNHIPCVENDLIEYNLYGYSTQVYIVTFYNASQTRLSGIVGASQFVSGSIKAPENTAYVVFSTSNSNAGTFTISTLQPINGDDTVSAINNLIADKTSIQRTNVVLNRSNVNVIAGSIYAGSNLGIYTLEQGRRTDYIPVSPGDTINYQAYAYIGTSVKTKTIAAFDAGKTLIDSIQGTETGYVSGTYTVPENAAYVMISWTWAMQYDGWFEINESTYTEELANYVLNSNAIPYSPLNGKKWCCLGDSITYGANTTKTYFNYIEDRCGITPFNFGESNTAIAKSSAGVTNNMATRYSSMFDDADYVTVFGGTNDHGQNIQIGQWGDTEQTTLYGAMKVLCDGLVAKYIGKKLGFILPLPKYGTTGGVSTDYSYPNSSFGPYIECIHDVCKRYSIPVLNLYLESGLAVGNADVRTALIPDGLHPNANGHEYISRKIQSFLERL